MVTFGIDVSHHQGGSLNFVAFKKVGVEFAFLKATESSGFVDSQFSSNLARARSAGMLVAAYHYLRSGVTIESQVANVVRVVPKDVPVIPDIEANSGTNVKTFLAFVAALKAAGYEVPFTYLPRWYWQQIGSPSLAGLPQLWSSRYPDNKVQDFKKEYADAPASYWSGYGDLEVRVLQYTSSANVAGVQPLDANAYLGTREQLAAELGGQVRKDDGMPEMYDKVKWTLDDGTVIEKTHSQILAAWYEANFITELAPPGPGGKRETILDAIWDNRTRIEAAKKLVSDLGIEMATALREALTVALQENPPTVQVDNEAIAKATVAEFKKEGN